MNKIFEEAFDRAVQTFGEIIYNQGYKQGSIDAVENGGSKEKYEQGLNDAWECAKKLRHMDYSMLYKVFDNKVIKHAIQREGLNAVFEKYSASEAIAKIKEYEETQNTCTDCIIKDSCETAKNGLSVTMCEQKQNKKSCKNCDRKDGDFCSHMLDCKNHSHWTPKQTEENHGEIMDFPNTFEKFAEQYGFVDKKEYYTNGSELIPVFRVEQWLEHLNVQAEKPLCIYTDGEIAKSFTEDVEAVKDQLPNQLVKIGDEIYSSMTETKAVVFHIDAWHRYECFTDSGSFMSLDEYTFNKYWVKTSKNYSQIVEVLEQMKGE